MRYLLPLLVGCFLLTGCNPDQVRKAEEAAATIKAELEKTQAILTQTEDLLARAKEAAAQPNATQVEKDAVATLEGMHKRLKDALPGMIAWASESEQIAKKTRENMESGKAAWDIALDIGTGLLLGGGPAALVAQRLVGRWKGTAISAINLAQELKPHAEREASPEEKEAIAAALKRAAAEQTSLGMKSQVDMIRHKGDSNV